MTTQLIISVSEWDTRVALVEEGRLAEFYLQRHREQDPSGNIYKGRVAKVLPGMASAFIELGLERPGYLYVEEVAEPWEDFYDLWLKTDTGEEWSQPRRQPATPIEDLLHEGQEILVQVYRPPLGNKGSRLTTYLSLAGHYLVFLPTASRVGVSRRIVDEGERARLKTLLEDLKPEEGGLIARTAGFGAPPEKLAQERDFLVSRWRQIQRKKEAVPAPALLYQEPEVVRRVLRDLFTQEVDRVVVDDAATYEQILQYLQSWGPLRKYQVELYPGPEPIFSHFGLEPDWQKLLAPRVWLKSGGYLLIEGTEALTAIDVNTGRFVGRRDLEETILKTNLEAAREVARQLRLRNIGGLIVIDFIDQEEAGNRDLVYQTLLEALKPDRAKTTVLPISPLGLVEMTRQRLRDSLAQLVTEPCTCCLGRGSVLTPLTLAHDLLRQLTSEAREFPGSRLRVKAHPEVLGLVRQEGEEFFTRLAQEHQVEIHLTDQPHMPRDFFEITREMG